MIVPTFTGDISFELDLELIKNLISKDFIISEEEKIERFKLFFETSRKELLEVMQSYEDTKTVDISGGKDSRLNLAMIVKNRQVFNNLKFHQFIIQTDIFDDKFKRLYNKLIIDKFISNEIISDFRLKTTSHKPKEGLWIKGYCTLLGIMTKKFQNEAEEFSFSKNDIECAKYIYDYFDDKEVAYCFYRYIIDITIDFIKSKREELLIKTPYVKGYLNKKKDVYDVFDSLYKEMFFFKRITENQTRDLYNFFIVNDCKEFLVYPFSDRRLDKELIKRNNIKVKKLPYKIICSPAQLPEKNFVWDIGEM